VFGVGLPEMVTLLLVLAVVVGVVVVLARRRPVPEGIDALPEDVLGLRQEVAALRAEARGALRHLSVVRYDAFGDMGGRLSFTAALLDDSGDGLLLTSIHGRSEARTYAKGVVSGRSEQTLSPEEEQAIELAMRGPKQG
jgi:hypothetical protein